MHGYLKLGGLPSTGERWSLSPKSLLLRQVLLQLLDFLSSPLLMLHSLFCGLVSSILQCLLCATHAFASGGCNGRMVCLPPAVHVFKNMKPF